MRAVIRSAYFMTFHWLPGILFSLVAVPQTYVLDNPCWLTVFDLVELHLLCPKRKKERSKCEVISSNGLVPVTYIGARVSWVPS
jgi:hypothetical protein